MTKIKLFGEIGKIFGKEHSLFLEKLSEFGPAMEANNPGFRKFLIDCDCEGKRYSLFVNGKLISQEQELQSVLRTAPKEITVVPLLSGSAYIIPTLYYVGQVIGTYLGSLGVYGTIIKLVAYAVVSAVVSALFAPKPKSSLQTSTANAGLNSYYFGGRTNRAQQGTPVPVVYGQLKVGSYVIQAGIRNLDKDDFAKLNNAGQGGGGSGTTVPSGTFIP
jgi:predicted phage tail protein